MSDLKTKVDMPVWRGNVDLWFYTRDASGMSVSSNLIMEKVPEACTVTQEPIRLTIPAAQELMDQLWQIGLRPSEGTGSAGSLKATERHLEDMRKLVFAGK